MLKKLLRVLLSFVALLAPTVGGLPLVLCVSQAHGAAIEVASTEHHGSSSEATGAQHLVLFGTRHQSADSSDCQDTRLQQCKLLVQSRHDRGSSVTGRSSDSHPSIADLPFNSTDQLLQIRALSVGFVHVDVPQLRSSLSDLRTIILQI